MNKLLNAGFNRLRKDTVFWVMMAAISLYSLINIWSGADSFQTMVQVGFVVTLDDYYFNQAPLLGIFFAVFVSLFLGAEYSDGMMRNKLSIGYTRVQVYLSNFLICLSADLALLLSWVICEIPGFFLIGPMKMGLSGYFTYLMIAIGFTAAFTAIFTLVGTLTTNKAFSVVLTLIVFIGMALAASALNDRLCEPEMHGGMAFMDGEFVEIEETPNPLYLTGMVRFICECLLDLLPTGQSILMSDVLIEHPARQILSALIVTILVTIAGISLFRKKDIR